jgi:putative Ca2+/H+ antiporter (TMEM165/GDT1 family)
VEALLVSALVVGLAEIGDKTQILSLMLAARFQRPVPVICGILCATSPITRQPVLPERLSEAYWQAPGCAGF